MCSQIRQHRAELPPPRESFAITRIQAPGLCELVGRRTLSKLAAIAANWYKSARPKQIT